MSEYAVFVLILASAGLFGLLCYGLGCLKTRQKAVDTMQVMYLYQIREMRLAAAELQLARVATNNGHAKLAAYTRHLETTMDDRMISLERLSVTAERLILTESGAQLRAVAEKMSDLIQPVVGFSELSEKLLKKVYMGRDTRLPQIRDFNQEISSSALRLRDFLGELNPFNASIEKRHKLAAKN